MLQWDFNFIGSLIKLTDMGINDDNTTLINIGDSIKPIGQKTGCEYFHSLISSLSDEQAHGSGEFDIRYHILKNPNWSLEEKQKLIMDFWSDDETYDECLEQWELEFVQKQKVLVPNNN